MSIVYQKNSDGSFKAWAVVVRRNNVHYRKYFKFDQLNAAKKYNEELIRTLPPKAKSGSSKGYKQLKKRGFVRSNPFKKGGCLLQIADVGERCVHNTDCYYYNDCLFEVAKRDWPGFTVKREDQ